MSTASSVLSDSQFLRFHDNNGTWISGCLLCLKIVGGSASPEELSTLEALHQCATGELPKASGSSKITR